LFFEQIKNIVAGLTSIMRGLFKLYASFLMATQGRSGERLLFVEAWVFEGMTTTFAFDCKNTDGIENFMQ